MSLPDTDAPQSPLFRKEALAHQRRTLYGEIILNSSVSSWVVSAVLALSLMSILALLVMIDIPTLDGTPLPLWRWLWQL